MAKKPTRRKRRARRQYDDELKAEAVQMLLDERQQDGTLILPFGPRGKPFYFTKLCMCANSSMPMNAVVLKHRLLGGGRQL